MVSLKIKILAASLLIALVPLLILGVVNLDKTTNILSDSVQDSLGTIVKSKESALEAYIDTTETAAKSVAATRDVQEYISYLNRELTAEEQAQKDIVEERVYNMLYTFQEAHWGKYHHVMIADLSGKVAVSPNHGNLEEVDHDSYHIVSDQDLSENPWFEPAKESTQVSDFSTWAESTHYHQVLMTPIKDAQGITQAVMVYELMITHEQEILTDNFKLGETGKVYLTTFDGTPVVHLKEDVKPALTTQGIHEANEKGSSVGIYANSEGIDVIGFYLKNEKHPWILVAEVEAAEAFHSVNEVKSYLIGGLIVTSLIVIVLALMLSNAIVNPIKKLTKVMDELTNGNFEVQLPEVKSHDEIQEMTSGLEMLKTSMKFLKESKKK